MGKYIGIKMIEATPMKASMALEHGYKIGNHNADELGYEISYPDGYVTANLAVSVVHSNKDMETPRRGIKQVHVHPLRGICNSHN